MFERMDARPHIDQHMPEMSIKCPYCRNVGIFFPYHGTADLQWARVLGSVVKSNNSIGIRLCPNQSCGGYVFALRQGDALKQTFPPQLIDFETANLPAPILASLTEAVQCHGAGCYRAAAIMVRRVLEELCEDRGAKAPTLAKRIELLRSSATLSNELLEAATELRILGNDAAHLESRSYDGIDKEEIDLAIELAKELLKAVYQQADLVKKLIARKKPVE